jgi:hypothetical protein
MSLIGLVATVLAVISALIQMLPVILIAAAVFGVVWWRRRSTNPASVHGNAVPPAVFRAPAAQARAIAPHPAGWVLMPVWVPTSEVHERRRYIDAEIIGEDNHHD